MTLLSVTARRAAHSPRLGPVRDALSSLPGSDALLLLTAALAALSVFELAAWLATAELSTLIYSVVLVPLALFITAIVSDRRT